MTPHRLLQHHECSPELDGDELSRSWQPDYVLAKREHLFLALAEDHACGSMDDDEADGGEALSRSQPVSRRLPRATFRWLKRAAPPALIQLLEHKLRSTAPTENGVVEVVLPNAYQRAVMHAICEYWGWPSWSADGGDRVRVTYVKRATDAAAVGSGALLEYLFERIF